MMKLLGTIVLQCGAFEVWGDEDEQEFAEKLLPQFREMTDQNKIAGFFSPKYKLVAVGKSPVAVTETWGEYTIRHEANTLEELKQMMPPPEIRLPNVSEPGLSVSESYKELLDKTEIDTTTFPSTPPKPPTVWPDEDIYRSLSVKAE